MKTNYMNIHTHTLCFYIILVVFLLVVTISFSLLVICHLVDM